MKKCSRIEAKEMCLEARYILDRMENTFSLPEKSKERIWTAIENIKNYETCKILEGVSVEEINSQKEGFRIKPLKDSGILSMADLIGKSPKQLYSIRGISPESARNIKDKATKYYNTAKSQVKIKINSDNKNPATTELIKAIIFYKDQKSIIDDCQRLENLHGEDIKNAANTLLISLDTLEWVFAGREKKNRAYIGFEYLYNLLNSEYGLVLGKTLKRIGYLASIPDEKAWALFEENSVSYYTIIEKFIKDDVQEESSLYGLPKELANKVKTEELKLDGLKVELRRYQEMGVKYILHQGNILLGDEMGLGKTVQAIAAMVALRNLGQKHFVVVCPGSVLVNWCREIEKFSDLNFTDVYGADRESELEEWKKNGGVAVTTFETAVHFILEKDFNFEMLVVDEAHYIKNPNAKRTENVRMLAQHARRMLFMTGTALENKVDEMISLVEMLNEKVALDVKKFRFMAQSEQFRYTVAPVYYRRKRDDVLTELPELIESQEWCRMNEKEERVYEETILSRDISKIRRVSWNVGNLQESSKAERLMEIVEEAKEDNRKLLIFTFFLETAQDIADFLEDKCVGVISGALDPQKRQELVDKFDGEDGGKALVAQIQSGGTGLNIQSASVVVICEPQFKPSTEKQAISRAYRLGQTRNVLVYRLLCENSIDERMLELLNSKQAVFDAFADKSKAAEADMEAGMAETAETEINESSLTNIINKEAERIEKKQK